MDRIETRALVAGKWRQGSGDLVQSRNPFDGSQITELRFTDASDVEEAVAGAKTAQTDAAWREMLPHNRARLLYRIGDKIEENAEAIASLQTLDTGKTLTETGALAASAAGTFRYYAAALETLEDAITPSRGEYLTMSVHEPIGVVGAITPWNSPIASDAQKIAPALAAGNAVILKPAEWTPLVSLALGRLCEEAGLPPGLLSILPGHGRETGAAIVSHPAIGKVSFTGGTQTGLTIARSAAAKLMPVSLELGGKSPTIVCDDADIERAIAGILFGIFSSTGQSCIAGSRLFVAQSLYAEFVDRLVSATRSLKVGNPRDSQTQVASMADHSHRDKVAAYVERARDEGGKVLCGGTIPGGKLRKGAFYMPTIIADLAPDAEALREEIFGPVLAVLPFQDDEDLIAQANDSVYGLACGIWSRDAARSWRIARRIEAGTVWINTYKQFSISTPFGGWKLSGMGREKGREGIRGYQHQKSIYWNMADAPHPWAGV
ncbi:aldehyde dehydrogenase [Novosphingopyxis iocasae]|uniref:aldehyde dehydrogenase n=1 Tax=Novosphingopyxis iocasae TaxID=2762729 RepID=UPI001651570C|nr:aldehyde dehydrogenase [Novosphingopyxis iocasae]